MRLILLLCAAALASAQETPTFSTEVKVVNVLATVRNKSGELAGHLERDDFLLTEDGRPQTIRYFARESDLPLTLGLLVDTSGSQQKVINAERGATMRFLDQVVRYNKDQVFLMQFDTRVRMREGPTASMGKLEEALAYVDTETQSQLRSQGWAGTLLYDAVSVACADIMKKYSGRKALIILSDGNDVGSGGTFQEAVEAAERADTLIYSILYSDSSDSGGRHVLQRMAEMSGGGFFEVTKKQSIEQIFGILEEELRNQYNIGYVSDKPVTISEFRAIGLTARQKGLTVQARRRYWAKR